MQSDILFDNIYIGHSVEDADKLAKESFEVKHPIEKALAEADKPKEDPKKHSSPSDLKFLDDPVTFIKEKIDLFLVIAQKDPIEAIKFVPEVSGGILAITLSLFALVFGLVATAGSSPAVQKAATDAKDKTKEAADKVASATTTGAEKAKAEVNKRTTRSQS